MKKYQLYGGLSLASLLMWYLTQQSGYNSGISSTLDTHFTVSWFSFKNSLNQPHEMLLFGAFLGLAIFAIYEYSNR